MCECALLFDNKNEMLQKFCVFYFMKISVIYINHDKKVYGHHRHIAFATDIARHHKHTPCPVHTGSKMFHIHYNCMCSVAAVKCINRTKYMGCEKVDFLLMLFLPLLLPFLLCLLRFSLSAFDQQGNHTHTAFE